MSSTTCAVTQNVESTGQADALASWIATQIRCAVHGMSTCLTPRYETASTTALWMAGVEPMVPDSPMPLAPIGLRGLSVWVLLTSKLGSSAADGSVGPGRPMQSAQAAVAQPQIFTRAQWGADESIRGTAPKYNSTIKAGFVLAIDDFGTGHSSLTRLRDLPVQILKIDRSFLRTVPENPQAAAIVAAILGLSRALGMTTVAEGVERPEQRTLLADLRAKTIAELRRTDAPFVDTMPATKQMQL